MMLSSVGPEDAATMLKASYLLQQMQFWRFLHCVLCILDDLVAQAVIFQVKIGIGTNSGLNKSSAGIALDRRHPQEKLIQILILC